MIIEIHRFAVLSFFFFIYIQAQDTQNVGGNVKINDPFAKPEIDPFAKPDVDPFAKLKLNDEKTTGKKPKTELTITRTIVNNERKSKTQGNRKSPVVEAGNVQNVNTASKKTSTKITTAGSIHRKSTGEQITKTKASNGDEKTVVRRTMVTTRNPLNGNDRSAKDLTKNNKQSGISNRKSSGRVTSRKNQGSDFNKENSDPRIKSNTISSTNVKASSTRSNSRQVGDSGAKRRVVVTKTQVTKGSSDIKRKSSNDQQREIILRNRNKIDRPNMSSTRNTNTVTDRSSMSSGLDSFKHQGLESPYDGTEVPILYVRNLYRDHRICENCIGDGTDCYLEHPDDCKKYIRCSASSIGSGMEALEMNCAFGTFWSNVANTCDQASEVFCEKDPCRDTRMKSYPSGINCRSYWRCVNGRSDSECCPHGQAYENGICVPSDSCKVDDGECPFRFRNSYEPLIPVDKEKRNQKPTCNLEGVENDATAFKMRNHWDIMRCPVGTRFDVNKCTCVSFPSGIRQCIPTAAMNFTTDTVRNDIKNYIEPNNVTNQNGYGAFDGSSFVAIPYFKNNQNIGSHFVIKVRFYQDSNLTRRGNHPDSQVLASNCKTKFGRELSPSFAILLSTDKQQVIFFASTKDDERKRYGATASISLPYKKDRWTIVELRFLNETLGAAVETYEKDGTSRVREDKKVLKGTLKTSVMPLMVGNCKMNDGYVGYIDQVRVYVCNPDGAWQQ